MITTINEWKRINEGNDKQLQKANELYNYIIHNLPEKLYDYITEPRTNHSNFGDSTYFKVITKERPVEGYKFRISDHSVTNIDRMRDEIHYDENSNIESIYNELLHRINNDIKNSEKRKKEWEEEKKRIKKLNNFWDKVKDDFKDLQFKVNNRTYQELDVFSKPHRSNIYQKSISGGAYYYEWTEEKDPKSLGKYKPSYEYIEKYLIPKYSNK